MGHKGEEDLYRFPLNMDTYSSVYVLINIIVLDLYYVRRKCHLSYLTLHKFYTLLCVDIFTYLLSLYVIVLTKSFLLKLKFFFQ